MKIQEKFTFMHFKLFQRLIYAQFFFARDKFSLNSV